LVALIPLRRRPQSSEPEQAYSIKSDGIAPANGYGWVLERGSGRIVVRSASTHATVFSYPESTVVLGDAAGANPVP
jgi:hypothetical protein